MRKFNAVFRYVTSSLVTLVAFVFTVLEATLLVTLDFTLYENPAIALLQLILRLLIGSGALTLGILSMVKGDKTFVPHAVCLLVSSAVMIPFVSNNIALYFTAVSALFLISQLMPSRMEK